MTLRSMSYVKTDPNGEFVSESIVLNPSTLSSPRVLYKQEETQVLLRDSDILI